MKQSSRIRVILLSASVATNLLCGGVTVSQAAQNAAQETAVRYYQDATLKQPEAAAKRNLDQAQAAEARTAVAFPAATADPVTPSPIVSVDFPGGTVQEYVQMLRAASKDPVNIAASEQLLSTQIPPITLTHVTLLNALRALGTIGDGSGMIDVRDLSMTGRGERIGSPIYEANWVPRRSSDEVSVTTYSLFDRIPSVTGDEATRMAETLVSAAQAALQMSGNSATWDLKFHQPSRLLLMKGTKGQIDIVSGVVDRMTVNWARDAVLNSSKNSTVHAVNTITQLRTELTQDIDVLRKQMEVYVQNYEARAQEAKKNSEPIGEMGQVEKLRYAALQESYNAKMARLRRVEDQLMNAQLGEIADRTILNRLEILEARLNEMTTFMEKRMGFAK